MKVRMIVMAVLVCLAGATVSFAADANMGTWKLNEAKSKFGAGATKNSTVVYTADGASTKVIVDGVDSDGKATHSEWTGKFDGKPYPVTGDATSDTRTYTRVSARTLTFTAKKGGKITLTGRITLSADGKTRTVTTTATDAKGKKVMATAVYDKQ